MRIASWHQLSLWKDTDLLMASRYPPCNTCDAIMNFDRELDARGLNCPLPILRAKKALNEMQSGQVLKIVATDPGAVKDFQAFSKQTGNELLSHAATQKEFTFYMKRK
jgi:tRNA 2-thiouridine synthesizing protein A